MSKYSHHKQTKAERLGFRLSSHQWRPGSAHQGDTFIVKLPHKDEGRKKVSSKGMHSSNFLCNKIVKGGWFLNQGIYWIMVVVQALKPISSDGLLEARVLGNVVFLFSLFLIKTPIFNHGSPTLKPLSNTNHLMKESYPNTLFGFFPFFTTGIDFNT